MLSLFLCKLGKVSNGGWLEIQVSSLLFVYFNLVAVCCLGQSLAYCQQRCPAFKIKNEDKGAPNWPMGSGKGSNPMFFGAANNVYKIRYLIRTAVP